MLLGFNHNIQYKGEIFHVQTEDSGISAPHIITLLYRGGVILCSQKTGYSDILKADNLEAIVEDLMKEQHKNMMRRLKSGEFDEKAFSINPKLIENYEIPSPEPEFCIPAEDNTVSTAAFYPGGNGGDSRLSGMPQEADRTTIQSGPEPSASHMAMSLDDAVSAFFENHDNHQES